MQDGLRAWTLIRDLFTSRPLGHDDANMLSLRMRQRRHRNKRTPVCLYNSDNVGSKLSYMHRHANISRPRYLNENK